MKNKKGFTIVELLSVLLIMGLIMAIAVPSIMAISNKIKEKSLNSKIELIETAAVNYAKDNSNLIKSSINVNNICPEIITDNTPNCYKKGTKLIIHPNNESSYEANNFYVYIIELQKLIDDGYYKSDKTASGECSVTDPSNNDNCLTNKKVIIELDENYKTATATFQK